MFMPTAGLALWSVFYEPGPLGDLLQIINFFLRLNAEAHVMFEPFANMEKSLC